MSIDKKIIKGCIKGEKDAQRQFFEHFAPIMLGISRRYAKSTTEAEDVVQESFIKIFKSISTFKGDSLIEFWVKRIVINTALNSQRGKLYLFPMVDINDVSLVSDQNFTLQNQELDDLYKMISELPEGCRVIFNLFAIEGYSHKEIAEMLTISEGTSKSQYARAKQLLQKKLLSDKSINYGTV